MARIRILPDQVVNRIAAGEVVERPSSVVKELVENALDAEATRVEVELAAGGRSLVRVLDDGLGMGEDDAVLALERHATSKLSSAADLEHISTLGFRGEALPSIAAVSRFRMSSCADPAEGGVEIVVEGGRMLGVEGCARGRGTTVEVRDLFFNTPARRKFLRAPETELRHAQDAIMAMALARPDVGFTLRHGSRVLVEAPPATDLERRLHDLLRRRGHNTVHRFEAEGGGMRAWGLLAPGGGSGRPQLTLLVNGRWVRDRLLVGAVNRVLRAAGSGYGGSRVVLLLSAPPDVVDVNVHPAKAEVRFARSGAVFGLVERALRGVIVAGHGEVPVRRFDGPPVGPQAGGPAWVSDTPADYGATQAPWAAATPGGSLFGHPVYAAPEGGSDQVENGDGQRLAQPMRGRHTAGARAGGRRYALRAPHRPVPRIVLVVGRRLWPGHRRSACRPRAGALRTDSAPVAGRTGAGSGPFEPSPDRRGRTAGGRFAANYGLLAQVGLEVDLFGPETIRVTSHPPDLDTEAAGQLVTEMLNRATDLDGVPERVGETLREELAAGLSCRAAVKVNDRLAEVEQRALLGDLAATADPYRCPHGRPIILRLSQEEMERRLGRR